MHQNGFTGGRPFGALCGVRLPRVEIAIHKIRNHLDGPLDVEFLDGLVQEIARDDGRAVALLDGKFGNRKIRTVAANECNVRAMQSGDEWETAGRSHGASEKRAYRMGNCIMDVEQIQRLGFEDFEHFGGESQGVRRMIEQRIGGDFNFVEENVRVVQVHADWWSVADEMDVMAASSKLLAKFRGDDAGTTVSGVAGYADSHQFRSRVRSEANIPACC